MPAIYQRSFEVRHYECDRYGHLNNVNYVRYMQEAALSASADVGWDMARYQTIGHQWLIRETEIEYLSALRYGETVIITTWVEDFRRVRSRRRYEFHRVGADGLAGELVAQGSTDWVYLHMATLRPASVPQAMIDAFMPEGIAEHGEKRPPFPEPPPAPQGIFVLPRRVEWSDIDSAGHVNNAAYFRYVEDVSTQVGRQFGWSMTAMEDAGIGIVCRRLRMVYLDSAKMDELLHVKTWWSDPKRAFLTRHYRIERAEDGALLARARGLWVCVDITTGRPMRLPPAMGEAFASNRAPL